MRRRPFSALRLVALLAFVAVLITAGTALAWDGAGSGTDWSGAGSASDPYVIGSAAQLKDLADSVNTGSTYAGVFFRLAGDIDLAGDPWTPIGGACALGADSVPTGDHFDGAFDGADHTISGISISSPAAGTGAYGLFGYVDGGTISNLTVAGSLDMGTDSVNEIGGVVGYARAGSLFNVHSAVTVSMHDATGSASMCGGIAGAVENPSTTSTTYVRYCSNAGAVTGRGRVGGIVGAVYCVSDGGVVVDQCFNTGDVTSTTSATKVYAGGIVGYCRGAISACYDQGRMASNGGHYLAGIVGMLQGADPVASLSRCYSTATFSTYDPGYDRFLFASADSSSAVHVSDCFWLPDALNADMSQPYDAAGSWGSQAYVSAVTADQLRGEAPLTGSNATGTFSGSLVDDYLGPADLDNAHGSYGFGYAAAGGYPVLGWQLIDGFKVDPASGVPAPVTTYAVSASIADGHGTATADPATVEAGGTCTITFAPAAGYWLGSITDNGVDVSSSVVGATYTLTGVTADHVVVVTYTNGTHALTYSAGAHGSISGAAAQTVADGTAGSAVTAVPAAGHHFAAWTDGSSANPRIDMGVTADLAVKAIFLPDDAATTRPWDHFTIAVVPDTQYYSASRPDIFEAQTQWIADHAKADNIVFVSQLGDLVDTYTSASQWQNARDSMAIVRAAGIPYSVVPGNHDIGFATHDASYFDATFPYTAFAGRPWYGGHYPATSNASNYELFSAMGQKFVVLNLVCDPTLLADATDWANSVLTQYADRKAIVVAHGYVDSSGAFISGEAVSGAAVWNDIVELHGNVVAVLCGHYSGEYAGTATGAAGNTVYDLLTDYQDDPDGGDGWLRLYEFYPLQDKVTAVTYSPYLDQYQTDADSSFDLPLTQDSHRVTFVSDGATYANVVAASDTQIDAPADPAQAGSTFAGWSSDAAGAGAVAFPFTVSVDTTLYAKWEQAAPITVLKPGTGAAWPRRTTQAVRWTLREPLASGRFTVRLLDAAGHARLTTRVAARSGDTSYTTRLRLSAAIKAGAYTVKVSSGSLSTVGARFHVVPVRALRVARPAGRVRWKRGAVKSVAWTLYRGLTSGSFSLRLRSARGKTYTFVPCFAPAHWSGRYATKVALPGRIPAGAGYHLIVRWQDGASVLGGSSKAITVTR